MSRRRLVVPVALVAAVMLPAAAPAAHSSDGPVVDLHSTAAREQPNWAPLQSATIRPGVRVSTESGGCTTNFVLYERHVDDEDNVTFDLFIGLAAHCFTQGGSTGTNGCTTPTRNHGSLATISGADHPGTLVYSSWVTMQAVDESDANTCRANDFAVVKLDRRDHDKVNPTLLHYGGPDGLRTTATGIGTEVFGYGNSSLWLDVSQLSPKRGYGTGTSNGGWTHRVYTAAPGVPGDSGSALVDGNGNALGVLVTLQVAPYAGSNGVTDMRRALQYARNRGGPDLRLALGTQPFEDPILP